MDHLLSGDLIKLEDSLSPTLRRTGSHGLIHDHRVSRTYGGRGLIALLKIAIPTTLS